MTNGHLVLLLSILVVSVNCQRAPETCTTQQVDSGELFCQNCLTVVRCNTASSPPDIVNTCSVGQVCGNVDNTVGCTTSTHLTDCNCNNLICDPYEENTVAVCSSAGILAHSKCQNGQTCLKGTCVDVPTTYIPTTTTNIDSCTGQALAQFHSPLPNCQYGFYCDKNSVFVHMGHCNDKSYFDLSYLGCLSLPPDHCKGCSKVMCPHKMDCSKYVICIERRVTEIISCSTYNPGFLYDMVTRRCVSPESGPTCHKNTLCVYKNITETTPDMATPSPAYNNYTTYSPVYNNYTNNYTTYPPNYNNYTNWTTYYPDYDNWTTYSPDYNNWTTYYPPHGPFPNNTGEDPNCKGKGNYSEGTVSIFYHFMAKWRTFLANFN